VSQSRCRSAKLKVRKILDTTIYQRLNPLLEGQTSEPIGNSQRRDVSSVERHQQATRLLPALMSAPEIIATLNT
jgi:hypothetical protein